MPRIILRPTFTRDLDGLRQSARKYYQRATEILLELQRDQDPSASRRPESRIPNCVKFELPDGYRLVLQRSDGDDALVALVVGTHDRVESFLDGHKGYVFDSKTGKVRELRLATVAESTVEIAPTPDLLAEEAPSSTVPPPLFSSLTDEMLANLGIPFEIVSQLRILNDSNSLECMTLLQDIAESNQQGADALLSYATGNSTTRQTVVDLASGNARLLTTFPASESKIIQASSEEFVSFSDPSDLEHVLEHGTLEQWQLFLHPDQKSLVDRSFNGPARLRGISGSGKTVVALHRARRLARAASSKGERILFTTYDKGLAIAASRLLDLLCGTERSAIEVTHLHRWCLDYIDFSGLPKPRYSPDDSREIRGQATSALPVLVREVLQSLPQDYIWQEIEFLMGRFLHEEAESYITTDRSGRGRALSSDQRRAILDLYVTYHRRLFDRGYVEPAEFVRMAYRQCRAGVIPEYTYASVIVDEVQDISEIGLRLLHSLIGDKEDGLLLVGDATQRIFTRGYTLKGLGIDISGRGILLRKNYRNTRQILEASFPLIAPDWDADVSQAGVSADEAKPEFSVREGLRPIVVRCKDEEAEERFLSREIATLLKYEHYKPRDICVVARNRYHRDRALEALRKADIPAYLFQRSGVGDVTADQNAVRVSTLHGAKGHEFGTVFVFGAVEGVIPQWAAANDSDVHAAEAAVLYVGMTRARDLLYLSFAMQDRAGKSQRQSSFIDRISSHVDFVNFRW